MEREDVERESEDTVRMRGAGPGLSAPPGVSGVAGLVESEAREAAVVGASSSSVHWRWRMTDFVAHCKQLSPDKSILTC